MGGTSYANGGMFSIGFLHTTRLLSARAKSTRESRFNYDSLGGELELSKHSLCYEYRVSLELNTVYAGSLVATTPRVYHRNKTTRPKPSP